MKFKLEFTFDISDSSLLIDANDGRSEEYTSLEDVPEDTLMDVVYNYLDGVIAVAESEMELWDLAEQLAYDNFQSYSCENDIAEEEGYDPDEMEESDWDELWSRVDESTYYSFSIEECEDDEEWNEYSGEIYGEDKVLQQRGFEG